jgi:uncharacterized caspase-like protein
LGPACLAVVLVLTMMARLTDAAEIRLALVVGNDEFKSGKLATPPNDTGLMADALMTARFIVTGARNLDQATPRESFREFLGQVAAAGPDAVTLFIAQGSGCNSRVTLCRSMPTLHAMSMCRFGQCLVGFHATAGGAAQTRENRYS